ncbi:PP2C family protein-serine/threonine phosphatase [Thauera linaloolentis]|uniref:Protein serine/threonine phosphatase n=1 Tax=Thauera linaloolentis (strain DSM 12138 / JCM 21573 / CCUG 41526 / CIP 105981 / IAM 15112 / NBRC 102519 / 47Lol) TaxID=1123367 RepID=N6Z5H4_THAL4|nr:protein phosphatase 2C domain-containing protein [Thauera linaloolentis]ENO89807.1 protein serine/threonine phosphatase [Thauera linaloolentis 47Lol = DSM 12138]MCM8567004.1 protein phosphatase 2C domain-containing protein [Thauera linaloolentis]
MAFSAETCVATHIGDRSEQQDRVGLFAHPKRPGIMMAALADGMGGHSGGAMAAEQVIIRARQNLESYAPLHETPQELLSSVIDEAHTVIKLTRFTSEKDPHSTAVTFLLQQGKAYWAHCGDSRFYYFRGTDTVSRSGDHSLVGELMRKGRLDEAGALKHPQRNVLLSCLGSEREPCIEYGLAEAPDAGDSFLLCSDGLWAYFTDFELASTIQAHPPRTAAECLVRMARERAGGAGDNISLIIVKLVPPAGGGIAR